MLALSIGMGLLLAFTRRNPYLTRSPYVVKWSGEQLTDMNFVLAAGGTGGHMVPAHALAAELKGRGHGVLLITDERGARFPGLFDERAGAHPSRRTARRRADRLAQGGRCGRSKGRGEAKRLYREHRPDAVVGFGGYPAFPSLLAASAMRIPTVLHEQNAVLGRVNRLLAGEAEAIGTAYDKVDRLKPRYRGKTVLVGNPVREEIAKLGELPFPPFDEVAPLKILVTGGSQGATMLGEVVPDGPRPARAFASPPAAGRPAMPPRRYRAGPRPICRARHSGRAADLYRGHARQARRRASGDRPRRRLDHRRADRRRPPGDPDPVPAATDDHQTANAREMTKAGGARTIQQASFTPEVLARQIEAMAADPVALNNAAARALSVGRPHAARDLADLVERVGNGLAPVAVGPVLSPRTARRAPAGGVPA